MDFYNLNFYIIFFIFINLLLYAFFESAKKIINIFDVPDKIRKFHIKPVSKIGGFILYINILLSVMLTILFTNSYNYLNISHNYQSLTIFLIIPTFIFIIGVYDDKFNISANKKLFLLSVLILFALIIDDNFVISNLNFYTFNQSIDISFVSFFFTTLCVLLFINAINMFDGINLQAGILSLMISVYFSLSGIFVFLFIPITIGLIIFLILNYQNKTFLGDSGTILLGYIISISFISAYNNYLIFYAEFIFLFMSIPGLDLFRLTIHRLILKKHPFSGDRNHIHHLLLNKFSFQKTILIIFSIIIIPFIILIFGHSLTISVSISIFLYTSIISYLFFTKSNK